MIFGSFEYKFNECINVHGNPSRIQNPHILFWMRMIFGRTRSRITGMLFDYEFPIHMREKAIGTFVAVTGADPQEARYPLRSYKSIGEFFSRSLKDEARPIIKGPPGTMNVPCDGTLANFGEVTQDRIEQIKGATYSLSSFLGVDALAECDKNHTKLMFATIYLAPGDYHRFHAPADCAMQITRHFVGEMLPVFSGLAKRFNDLFCVNERVVMSGSWEMGALHYSAVAAYNVGGIIIPCEPKLKTNSYRVISSSYLGGDIRSKVRKDPHVFESGEEIGRFALGSTVVVVFEAPPSFEFTKEKGAKVKLGEIMGQC